MPYPNPKDFLKLISHIAETCNVCHALVLNDDWLKHKKWHRA